MTKVFCNRCEELIPDNKYVTGSTQHVPGPKGFENVLFTVEISIRHAADKWHLCQYCAHEIMDEADAQRKQAQSLLPAQ